MHPREPGSHPTLLKQRGAFPTPTRPRVFGIARGETIEGVCAVETAVDAGAGSREALGHVLTHGNALLAMLTALSRAGSRGAHGARAEMRGDVWHPRRRGSLLPSLTLLFEEALAGLQSCRDAVRGWLRR